MWVTADLIAVDQTVGTSVRMEIRRRNWASDDFDFIHQFETYFVDLTQFLPRVTPLQWMKAEDDVSTSS